MAEAQTPTISDDIRKMEAQFKAALPEHVTPEKFVRVVLTAVNGNPDLANADRRSLLESAMKAAQDGLLPDGREAAFVVFNTKQGGGWIKKVQYLPMVWGIVKKVRNSGELESITAQVVYENDEFDWTLGDNETLTHKPRLIGDRGAMTLCYAIAKTKDGGIYREVMTRQEVEAVKGISKAKDTGPWSGPFESEMWRKTVIRRLSKRLPVSSDLEQVINRDDEMYDLARDVTPSGEAPKLAAPRYKLSETKRKAFFQASEHIPRDVLMAKLMEFEYQSTYDISSDKLPELMEWAKNWTSPQDENNAPSMSMSEFAPDPIDDIPDFEVPK